ncbi:MAG: MarR family transcriptional regulator [Candidatus Acidiferrales bacterium]
MEKRPLFEKERLHEKGHRPTQREKTARAFRAYVDLLDTAEYMKARLRGQLESFDLTMQGFRLLEMLYREGPVTVPDAAEKRGCKRQNMDVIVARLKERGWVERAVVRDPATAIPECDPPKLVRGKRRMGSRVAMVRLTKLGTRFMGTVFPRHAKTVKAWMRCLDGREQESLSHICAKLREGHFLKFVSEITHVHEGDEGEEDVVFQC